MEGYMQGGKKEDGKIHEKRIEGWKDIGKEEKGMEGYRKGGEEDGRI